MRSSPEDFDGPNPELKPEGEGEKGFNKVKQARKVTTDFDAQKISISFEVKKC